MGRSVSSWEYANLKGLHRLKAPPLSRQVAGKASQKTQETWQLIGQFGDEAD
jgi:hypothetical protein